jgi:hypothetical protein
VKTMNSHGRWRIREANSLTLCARSTFPPTR